MATMTCPLRCTGIGTNLVGPARARRLEARGLFWEAGAVGLLQLLDGFSLQGHDLEVLTGLQGLRIGAEALFLSLGSAALWGQ